MPKNTVHKIEQSLANDLKSLTKDAKELAKEVKKLKELEFFQVFKHPWKFMWFSLLKGMMVGLGSVIGASVLVGFLVYLIGQISFVPILGDFVEDIITQINLNNRSQQQIEN